MKKALGIIILLFLCVGTCLANAGSIKFMGNPESFELISLYAQPSLDSAVLGEYYPGAEAVFIGSENGWSGVIVGKDPGTLAGYVQDDCLLDEWNGKIEDAYPSQYCSVWSETDSSVPVYVLPDETSPSLGEYLINTIVRRVGECGDWSHIEFGGYGTAFIRTENLLTTTRAFQPFTGVEPIGFVRFTARLDVDMSTRFFPSMDAEIVEFEQRDATSNVTLTLIAELDGWCQVRNTTDLTTGFVPTENLDIYTFDTLFIDTDISLSAGRYMVEKDMPSGLYEFHVEDDKIGYITISGSGTGHDRTHEVKGKSIYSLFIPPKSTVELKSGILKSASREMLVSETKPYAGNGRFLIGCQIPGGYEYDMTLQTYDPVSDGIYSFSSITGHDTYYGRKSLTENGEYVYGHSGFFIEVENAIISITPVK